MSDMKSPRTVTAPPKVILPSARKMSLGKMNFMDFDPKEIARQLTLIDSEMLRSISPFECTNAVNLKSSPLVMTIINRFNSVSNWVATEILSQFNLKKRTRILKRFIKLAHECLSLHNFNSLYAILAGLNYAPVQRLKKTIKALSHRYQKNWRQMEAIFENIQNFKSYRHTLKRFEMPIIPYFGLFLRDITFVDAGNPDKFNDGQINFEKLSMIAAIIRDMEFYQTALYPFLAVPVLQAYLIKPKIIDADTMYENSLLCEENEN